MSEPSAVLTADGRAALTTVLALLAEDRASLSSVTDERAWRVHVDDSLTGLELPELHGAERIADLGAGAGFPGLPLAVALPEAHVDLVESVSRKCDFIRRAAAAAAIANASVVCSRSEDLAETNEGRESYDVVSARAVGRLSTLAELASPLLRDGGFLVAWKGKRDADEEAELARASEALAMQPREILAVGDRAGSEHRHLHLVRKTGPTPADLPRRPGVAKKRPKGRA